MILIIKRIGEIDMMKTSIHNINDAKKEIKEFIKKYNIDVCEFEIEGATLQGMFSADSSNDLEIRKLM